MTVSIEEVAGYARRAVQAQDWPAVARSADEILRHDENSAEGHFLWGLVERIQRRPQKAIQAFERVLEIDPERYDAAVELANQYSIARRNADVAALLARYEDKLSNSPMYLDLAGTIYTEIGMPQKAWPLYEKAVELQPGVDLGAEIEGNRIEQHRIDGEIDIAGLQAVGEALGGRRDGEIDEGCLSADAGEKRGKDQGVEQVGGDEAEGACGLRRVEGLRLGQGPGETEQAASKRNCKRLGARGEHHPPTGSHQQRVVKELAKPAERVAHRRLGDARAFGGFGHAELAGEGV